MPTFDPQKDLSEEVTVLVFKDQLASRSFRLPLAWLNRAGWAINVLALTVIVSVAFSVRYYRRAVQGDPSRARDLEVELSDLRAAYQTLETRVGTQAPATVAPVSATPVGAALTQPAPDSTDVPRARAVPFLFSYLAPSAVQEIPDRASLGFVVQAMRTSWSGKTLKLGLNILYTAEDGGSQQGRIVMVARGPDHMLGYPAGIFSTIGASELLSPTKGEYFSVSRFRE
ncbi:MAG: hypothetical protein AAB425_04735, partial [Bdellovibrionota bacterium]